MLTVYVGTGGWVEVDGEPLPEDGTVYYADVVLEAIPDEGYTFTYWNDSKYGGQRVETNPWAVEVDCTRTVTAVFDSGGGDHHDDDSSSGCFISSLPF
ncbi:MAG: hypothetical protein JXO48_04585 [Deltaproteobacteria bacterium]|nr:hypothetical protein [Deltaproteobacteria bacterium]